MCRQAVAAQYQGRAGRHAGDGGLYDVEAVGIFAEHPALHDRLPDAAVRFQRMAGLAVQLGDQLAAMDAHEPAREARVRQRQVQALYMPSAWSLGASRQPTPQMLFTGVSCKMRAAGFTRQAHKVQHAA